MSGRKQRDGIQQHHADILRQICGVRRSVPDVIVQQELGVTLLPGQWQQQTLRHWNQFAALPDGSLYKVIAQDDFRAAQQGQKNWTAGLRDSLEPYKIGLVDGSGNLQQISKPEVAAAVTAAKDAKQQRTALMDPRIAPSDGAKTCTFQAWFARPGWADGPEFLAAESFSATAACCYAAALGITSTAS